MRHCSGSANNRYRFARLKAAKSNRQLGSMETASEKLYISRRTLWDIENGLSVPSALTVSRMAEVYKAPELRYWFCHEECPIGHSINSRLIKGMRPEMIALHVLYLVSDARRIADNLAEAVRKGNYTGTAIQAFISWSADIAQLGNELTVILEKGGNHASLHSNTESEPHLHDD